MATATKVRSKKMTKEQKETMIAFMESNPQLASGALNNNFTHADANKLWDQLSDQLASCTNGALNKTRDDWKKTWTDIKSRTKVKAQVAKKHSMGTGGGPVSSVTLNDAEEKIISVIGRMAVDGMNIPEFGVQTLQLEHSKEDVAFIKFEKSDMEIETTLKKEGIVEEDVVEPPKKKFKKINTPVQNKQEGIDKLIVVEERKAAALEDMAESFKAIARACTTLIDRLN